MNKKFRLLVYKYPLASCRRKVWSNNMGKHISLYHGGLRGGKPNSMEKEIHMKKLRFIATTLAVILMGIALLMPLSAQAAVSHTSSAKAAPSVTNRFSGIPVSGTTSTGGTFTGRLNVTSFANDAGSLVANGTLNGVVRNAAGNVVGTVNNLAVTLPVDPTTATCTILNLVLGPLDLNVLGLMVHLNQVVLTITANPAGGLLGQLLCDIANLLNNGGLAANINAIVADLNRIVALLGG